MKSSTDKREWTSEHFLETELYCVCSSVPSVPFTGTWKRGEERYHFLWGDFKWWLRIFQAEFSLKLSIWGAGIFKIEILQDFRTEKREKRAERKKSKFWILLLFINFISFFHLWGSFLEMSTQFFYWNSCELQDIYFHSYFLLLIQYSVHLYPLSLITRQKALIFNIRRGGKYLHLWGMLIIFT